MLLLPHYIIPPHGMLQPSRQKQLRRVRYLDGVAVHATQLRRKNIRDPSQGEIAAACAEIRSKWTREEELQRWWRSNSMRNEAMRTGRIFILHTSQQQTANLKLAETDETN